MTEALGLAFINVPGRAFPAEKALSLTGVSNFKRGRVQVLSDTHLAIPVSEHHVAEPEDDHLYRYLRKINEEIRCADDPSSFEVLVFNGDTFEITGSCASYGEGHLPYLADGSLCKPELTRAVISEILKSNEKVIGELKRFLASSPNHKIVFVKGNHDAFLGMDEETQKMIKQQLTGDIKTKQVVFCSELEIPELKLYARHGQDLDSMNNTAANRLNKGDLLNFMAFRLSKIVVDEIATLHKRFKGQATKLINEFQQQVERISNFRPLPSFWLYMDMLVAKYSSKAKAIKGLPEAILQVGNNFYNGFHKIASNDQFVKEFEALYCSPLFSKLLKQVPLSLKERSLRSKPIQKIITHSAAKLHDWFSTNKPQFDEAIRIIAANPDINVVTFGHTHRQSDDRGYLFDLLGRAREFRVVNSGTWAGSVYASPVTGSGALRFLREQKNSGALTVEYDGQSDEATYRTSFYETVVAKLGLKKHP